jgi:membrane protein implicated in regulation of membrane protease activity
MTSGDMVIGFILMVNLLLLAGKLFAGFQLSWFWVFFPIIVLFGAAFTVYITTLAMGLSIPKVRGRR